MLKLYVPANHRNMQADIWSKRSHLMFVIRLSQEADVKRFWLFSAGGRIVSLCDRGDKNRFLKTQTVMFSDTDHVVLVPKHKNTDETERNEHKVVPERNVQCFFICGFAETFSDLWPLSVSDCCYRVVVPQNEEFPRRHHSTRSLTSRLVKQPAEPQQKPREPVWIRPQLKERSVVLFVTKQSE